MKKIILALIVSFILLLTIIPSNSSASIISPDVYNQELVFEKDQVLSTIGVFTAMDVVTEGSNFVLLARNQTNGNLYAATGDVSIGSCSALTSIDSSGSIFLSIQAFGIAFGASPSKDLNHLIMFYNQNGYLFASIVHNKASVENKTNLLGGGAVSSFVASAGYGYLYQEGFGYIFYLAVTFSGGNVQVYAVKFYRETLGDFSWKVTFTLSSNNYAVQPTSGERALVYNDVLFNSSATPTTKSPYYRDLGYANATNQITTGAATPITGWYGYTVCKIDSFVGWSHGFIQGAVAILANTANEAKIGLFNHGVGTLDATQDTYGQADTTQDLLYGLDGQAQYLALSCAKNTTGDKTVAFVNFNSTTDFNTAMYNDSISNFGYSHTWIYWGIITCIMIESITYKMHFFTTYSPLDDEEELPEPEAIMQEAEILINSTGTGGSGGDDEDNFSIISDGLFMGIIWLFIVMFLPVVMHYFIPKYGFFLGLLLMTGALGIGLASTGFFMITFTALAGLLIFWWKGEL